MSAPRKDPVSPVKQHILVAMALSFLACEAAPPVPPPEPDHLVKDIAKLNADLLACMQRENDRLRQDRDDLEAKIRIALVEAAVLASEAPKKPRRQP